MKKLDRVSDIYVQFHAKYFKKKSTNLCLKDFYFVKEEPLIFAEDGQTAVLFDQVPLFPDTPITEVQDNVIVMAKKAYKDELLDDHELYARNQTKLSQIKSFDLSSPSMRSPTSTVDSSEYRSPTAAKFYEVFPAKKRSRQGVVRPTSCWGIDAESIFIITDTTGRHTEDSFSQSLLSQRVIKPSFPITCITSYGMFDQRYLRITVKLDKLNEEIYLLESDNMKRIHNKIQYILTEVYGRGKGGTTGGAVSP